MKPQRPPRSATVAAHASVPASTSSARMLAMLLGAATLLAGCADSPLFQQTPARSKSHPRATAVLERESAPAREAPSRREPDAAPKDAALGLREGIRLYNEGDFDGAIRRLSGRDVNNGPLATRLSAIKYTAFSYCVTGRTAQCRQSFDKALRLDPSFELDPGEQGHPLWGPVFTKAKQAAGGR